MVTPAVQPRYGERMGCDSLVMRIDTAGTLASNLSFRGTPGWGLLLVRSSVSSVQADLQYIGELRPAGVQHIRGAVRVHADHFVPVTVDPATGDTNPSGHKVGQKRDGRSRLRPGRHVVSRERAARRGIRALHCRSRRRGSEASSAASDSSAFIPEPWTWLAADWRFRASARIEPGGGSFVLAGRRWNAHATADLRWLLRCCVAGERELKIAMRYSCLDSQGPPR
jgi:hypothetical protein